MPSLNSLYLSIKDGAAVRAAIPLQGSPEKERLNCFFEQGAPPIFRLQFPFGILPVEQVDTSQSCLVMVDFADATLTISADIQKINDSQTLELVARESVLHQQARSHFRVDVSTKVAASAISQETETEADTHWQLQGDTIDLSGSGLLCSFPEAIEKDKEVLIELTLPTMDQEVIRALGHVVRCRKIKQHLFHVALHFDSIDSESQDRIMACCFELQRRHLRMRVRLENPMPTT